MVTKRQQLKWLAKRFESLPFDGDSILMSNDVLGYLGHEHEITNQELKQERDKMQKKAHQKAIDEMASVILDYDGYMITSATAELVARQLHYAGYHK